MTVKVLIYSNLYDIQLIKGSTFQFLTNPLSLAIDANAWAEAFGVLSRRGEVKFT